MRLRSVFILVVLDGMSAHIFKVYVVCRVIEFAVSVFIFPLDDPSIVKSGYEVLSSYYHSSD